MMIIIIARREDLDIKKYYSKKIFKYICLFPTCLYFL